MLFIPLRQAKIVTAEALGETVVIGVDDGRQCAYSAETLCLLMPMEFELVKKVNEITRTTDEQDTIKARSCREPVPSLPAIAGL
jgi:hypothetical protein